MNRSAALHALNLNKDDTFLIEMKAGGFEAMNHAWRWCQLKLRFELSKPQYLILKNMRGFSEISGYIDKNFQISIATTHLQRGMVKRLLEARYIQLFALRV